MTTWSTFHGTYWAGISRFSYLKYKIVSLLQVSLYQCRPGLSPGNWPGLSRCHGVNAHCVSVQTVIIGDKCGQIKKESTFTFHRKVWFNSWRKRKFYHFLSWMEKSILIDNLLDTMLAISEWLNEIQTGLFASHA